ncbi:MAG: protein kinase [Deltaproteobacteria bacterium]|nr:protein kinase [Deltaproteobacteria bacterium]
MNNDPFVGKVIDGRYEIQVRIGEGGMGVVYKARQISIDRVIALKMLNSQMANDPTWVQRFYNEAKACSRLQHPNTIRMFDFGQTSDGRLFMTMEFLDGMSLRDALAKGPLAPQRVVKVLIQCCASLAEAHSIGIIHRDIKPDNVFLLNMAGSPDFVKLLDFSVAKLLEGDRLKTQAGVVFGTPQYMSPEQGRGLPLDARSDLYALGILAFEMLTGTVPFHDENPMTVIQMHLHAGVPPMADQIPYSVQQIVRRALEKDAGRRYQSSGEMMQHCQQVFAELTAGGMSIGAGGMPRTVVAPNPGGGMPAHMQPPGGMGMQGGLPPGMNPSGPPLQQQQPQGGYQQASPQQKTMVAQMSPFAQGAPQQQAASGLAQAPGGFQQSSPMQKTIVAGMTPPNLAAMGMQQPGMPPGMQPGMMQPPGMPPGMMHPASGPQKTVALQTTEGIVSMARTGQAVQPATTTGAIQQGATTLFWIVSLFIGVAIGALAYVVVLQL